MRRQRRKAGDLAARARARVTTLIVDRPELSFEDRGGVAMRESAAAAVAEARHPADLMALAAEAVALAEDLAAEGRKIAPPARPIACRAGCGHCCHISVMASAAEVLRLAQHVRNRFSSAALSALVGRLREAAAMSKDERLAAFLPCPMLEHDSCSVYEARPLNCRGLESMDVELCRRASRGEKVMPPIYAMRWAIFNRVERGLLAGTADAGRALEPLDLFAALLTALETPDAARRWLDGEPVFAHCRWPMP